MNDTVNKWYDRNYRALMLSQMGVEIFLIALLVAIDLGTLWLTWEMWRLMKLACTVR